MIAIEIPKTVYLTVSYSRRLGAEEPLRYINPHRSKFMTRCNGPVAAIAGAASALSAGFATKGLLGGLMLAGGVAGILGAVTGNKTLSALGSIAGLAGGFVTPEGAFNNPFTSFGESATAKGFGSVFDSLKESLGITSELPDFVPAYDGAEEVIKNAGGNGGILDKVKDAAVVIDEKPKGILEQLGGAKDLLGLAGGAAEAYQMQPLVDARIDNLEANTAATQTQAGILQQRQNNMQFQNTGNMPQVNADANVYGNTQPPGSANGRYAVVVDGQVKYITQQEYQQLQAAKQNGTGLINQGTP